MIKDYRQKTVWLFALIWTAVIFSASLQNGADSGHLSGNITKAVLEFLNSLGIRLSFDDAHFLIRKAAHFSEYAVLGLLVAHAERKAPLLKSDALCIGLWMVTVPLMDEWIQHFVSGRYGAFADSLLDMCGFFCAWMLYTLFTKQKKQ